MDIDRDGTFFFCANDLTLLQANSVLQAKKAAAEPKGAPRIAIFWDSSLSCGAASLDEPRKRELKLIESLCAEFDTLTIDLYFMRHVSGGCTDV